MAYVSDENAGGLDVLTTLATGDLHIIGDVSDSNRAKAITEDNLEIVIANATTFVDELIANNYFTTNLAGDSNFQSALAGDSNFVTLLTSNSLFQTLVQNFAGGGGSGGGGTKLAIDTTPSSYSGGVGGTAYTIPIPGGTLGTNNAIRFKVLLSSVTVDTGLGFIVKYGGTTLGQMTFTNSFSSDGGIIFGEIIADGATNAQKFIGTSLGLVSTSGTIKSDTQYDGASVEDSTISQDLEIEVNPSGTSSVTVQAIIVEAITDAGIQTDEIALSSADILALNATPVELVAAPGAGRIIDVEEVVYSLTAGTQYAGGNDLLVRYAGDTQNLVNPKSAATGINSAADKVFKVVPLSDAVTEFQDLTAGDNTAVQLSTASAYTTGTGTLKVFITYKILTI